MTKKSEKELYNGCFPGMIQFLIVAILVLLGVIKLFELL